MQNNIQPKRFRNVSSGNAKVGGIWFAIQVIGYLIRMILKVTDDDKSPWERRD
ncbi:MAG: hypothetical protein IKG82_03630 [Oscillospiraceae bacterium]|nr:hypothetical protein [Oscillospiraceae bacterium]